MKWVEAARADLDAEMSYLSKEDEDMALKAYATIRNQVNLLAQFPNKGRSGRVFGTRELVIQHYSYIVPYRVKDNTIEILSVFHTKRQLPQTW